MLTLIFKANEKEIGRVEIVNRGKPFDFTHKLPEDTRIYEVSYAITSESGARRAGEFMLLHERSDGAAALAQKALKEIRKGGAG